MFSEILVRVPKAELILKSISFIEREEQIRIKRKFVDYGIEEERLIIYPWVKGKYNHLKCYADCDVGLDPIPYGGATTTCEALAMGVPVLTYRHGVHMVNKLTESILMSCNKDNWIKENKEELIIAATELAEKGVRKKRDRIELRNDILRSDLCDGKRLAEQITRIAFEAIMN